MVFNVFFLFQIILFANFQPTHFWNNWVGELTKIKWKKSHNFRVHVCLLPSPFFVLEIRHVMLFDQYTQKKRKNMHLVITNLYTDLCIFRWKKITYCYFPNWNTLSRVPHMFKIFFKCSRLGTSSSWRGIWQIYVSCEMIRRE